MTRRPRTATTRRRIPTRVSHLLAGLTPEAQIRIYPDAAHGFLFQYPTDVAAVINEFLATDKGS